MPSEQFGELNDDVYHASFGAQFFSGLVSPATTFIGNLSYVAVAVVGGLQVATGQITLGSIQAFIQYVRQFNQPLTQVAGMYNTLQSGVASAERVFDLLDAEEQSPDPVATLDSPTTVAVDPAASSSSTSTSAYRAGTPVIEDLSLVAEPGSHGGDRRAHRRGQDDAGEPADAVLRRRLRPDPARRRRHLDDQPPFTAIADRDGAAGHLAVRRHDLRQHRLRPAGRRPRTR